MKGKFIVIEGIDGSGKSTIAKKLAETLNENNIETIYTFEPTNAYYGAKLRDTMLSKDMDLDRELELFVDDRKEHIRLMIKPTLEEGKTVVLDRYMYSSIAYQGAKGIDIEKIKNMHESFILIPDIVFIFHLPVEKSLNRIIEKRGFIDRFENEEYLKKVDSIFKSFNDSFIYHINADKSIDDINKELIEILKQTKMLAPNFPL